MDEYMYKSKRDAGIEGLELFAVPDIRTPVPSAPGSVSSQLAADAIDGPFRRKSHRAVMLVLGALPPEATLCREQIAARTGYKESSLCGRLAELSPTWVEAVSCAQIAASGLRVNGYRLTSAGRNRLKDAV